MQGLKALQLGLSLDQVKDRPSARAGAGSASTHSGQLRLQCCILLAQPLTFGPGVVVLLLQHLGQALSLSALALPRITLGS